MTDKTDSKERDLMALIDAYAEARHIGGCHTYNAKTAEARNAVIAKLAASAGSEPVAWTGGEEWEQLAWHLCAEEHGEDACDEVIWEGGPIPEPWGARWMKYESDAKRMIELVRRFYTHPSPSEGMVGGWMPIETAPKDMGAYLFMCGGVAVEGFIDATGTYCVRQEAGSGWRKMWRNPTHWMPLPEAPPTTSAGSGKGE